MRERLSDLLTLEFAGLLTAFGLFSYVFYQIFLRKVNASRHNLFKRLFKDAVISYFGFAIVFGTYYFLLFRGIQPTAEVYAGIAAICMGSFFFIRTCKIVVFEYLFLSRMREGVPVLLVNLVTLVISIFLASWILTSVFVIRLAPLLATSALLSVVLGLALQDTLGNLFAGVALQFDKPYEIGDWVEVHTEKQVFVGEVHEITWRATILFGFFDEVLTIPNRVMSQSEVMNFSGRKKPVYQGFKVYLDPLADPVAVKAIFDQHLKEVPGIIQNRAHYVMLRELGEHGALWRVAYPIENYGRQYIIVNEMLLRVQRDLKKQGISLGKFRIETHSEVKIAAT